MIPSSTTRARSSLLMACTLAALWAGAARCAPLERELHVVVTVDAEQSWSKDDPKYPGHQWSKATSRQRWELKTRLRSDGKLQVRDLLDPDLNTRMEAKTIFLARQAKALFEQSGKPFKIPHTDAEKSALMQEMQEQIMGCKGQETCTHDMTLQYAALMAAIEFPEALEEDTVPGQYLYFLPFKGCADESRVTVDMAIDGERYNKDVDHLVQFSEHRSADTVNASDGLALCEHFAAVIDTKEPKKLVRQENIFIPRPEGTTDYTERGHTSHRQEPQPLIGAAMNWVNDTLRHAPESGNASATLPLPMSLNGNSTWLGLWQGTAKVSLQWTFSNVAPTAVAAPPK
ncbi:MAG: hypothetical protein JWR07_4937 [Nevskia sp.]|nr:hypothetical protein [Nevskia sp.]